MQNSFSFFARKTIIEHQMYFKEEENKKLEQWFPVGWSSETKTSPSMILHTRRPRNQLNTHHIVASFIFPRKEFEILFFNIIPNYLYHFISINLYHTIFTVTFYNLNNSFSFQCLFCNNINRISILCHYALIDLLRQNMPSISVFLFGHLLPSYK